MDWNRTLETEVDTTSNQGFSVDTSTQQEATGTVAFDGAVLVDGAADHPGRPAPFIRPDEEWTTRPS